MTGTGFADQEALDVYFDTVDTQLLVSSSTGGFSTTFTIPAAAAPGAHFVTAIGRRSGDAAQVALRVTTPWWEASFGAASKNWNPFENTLSTANVGSLGMLWSAPAVSIEGAPAVVYPYVYVPEINGIQALKEVNGGVQWTALTTSSFEATPAVTGGYVYVGSDQGVMYALAYATGAVKWSTAAYPGNFSSAIVANGIVYAGNIDGVFYAFSQSTGALLWSYTVDVGTTGSNGIQGAPALADGIVYFGSYNGYVYALNATTGALYWKLSTGGPITDSVSLGNGLLYVAGGPDNEIYAIITKLTGAGTVRWAYAANVGFGTPAVAGNLVYAGSENDRLYALNAATGALVWSAATNGYVDSEPTVANGVVYAGDDSGDLYAFDATNGTQLWLEVLGNPLATRAVISDGVVYASNVDVVPVDTAETYAFSLLAGTQVVRPSSRAPLISSLHPDERLTVRQQGK